MQDLVRRVEVLEENMDSLVTKRDIQAVSESVEGLVAAIKTGSNMYRFMLGLGGLCEAIGGIIFGVKNVIAEVLT